MIYGLKQAHVVTMESARVDQYINDGWQLVRHQIRRGEILHADIENKRLPSCLELTKMTIASKTSSAQGTEGAMYEITITPSPEAEITLEMLVVLAPRAIEN